MYHDPALAKSATKLDRKADPRPKSAVSTGCGVAGLAGLLAWIAYARLHDPVLDGPYLGDGRTCSRAAMPMVLWSLIVDKVHRNPSTGIDWDHIKPWARDPRDQHHQDHRPVGDLGRDRADLCGRALLLAGRVRVLDVVFPDRGAGGVRALDPVHPVFRPPRGGAQGRLLQVRLLADGHRRGQGSRGDLPPSARLGGEGVLPRVHARDRAAGVRRFRARRHQRRC